MAKLGGGGGLPPGFYCHLLGLGVLSISHSQYPIPIPISSPQSPIPVPNARPSLSRLTISTLILEHSFMVKSYGGNVQVAIW